jgi:hypothetical protein
MSHNSHGGWRSIRAHEHLLTALEIERRDQANYWRAFDKLPSEVRALLANAACNWAPQPVLTQWRRGRTVEQIAKAIEHWDAGRRRPTPRPDLAGSGGEAAP